MSAHGQSTEPASQPPDVLSRPDARSPSAGETQQALRWQLRRLLDDATSARERDLPIDDLLRPRLRETCAVARGAGMPVEQVLVSLKEEWHAGTERRRLSHVEGTRLLARVVTLCIHAYYDAVRSH